MHYGHIVGKRNKKNSCHENQKKHLAFTTVVSYFPVAMYWQAYSFIGMKSVKILIFPELCPILLKSATPGTEMGV
jgi:hypothetical protein